MGNSVSTIIGYGVSLKPQDETLFSHSEGYDEEFEAEVTDWIEANGGTLNYELAGDYRDDERIEYSFVSISSSTARFYLGEPVDLLTPYQSQHSEKELRVLQDFIDLYVPGAVPAWRVWILQS